MLPSAHCKPKYPEERNGGAPSRYALYSVGIVGRRLCDMSAPEPAYDNRYPTGRISSNSLVAAPRNRGAPACR